MTRSRDDPTVQETAATAARTALVDDLFDVSVDPESCRLDEASRGPGDSRTRRRP